MDDICYECIEIFSDDPHDMYAGKYEWVLWKCKEWKNGYNVLWISES